MKPVFSDIVGNKRLCARFADDVLRGSLSHAYILEGAHGTGKHTLALQLAAALSCEQKKEDRVPLPCKECASCRKILGGHSTDVSVKGKEDKATLGVEIVRQIRQDIVIPPNDGDVKLYIIEDAHLMTESAQNALLLTLEEPPPYVLFLLLCESASPLLETIRSRAPVFRTEPIPPSQIEAYICAQKKEAEALRRTAPEEFSELLAAADGSIGRALELLDPSRRRPILTRRSHAREFIALCDGRKNSAAAMRFLNGLGQKREELIGQLGMILLSLRDLLLCKQTENAPLCFFGNREEAFDLAYRFTTPRLLALCDALGQAIERLQANANVRLTLTELAVKTDLM